MQHNKQRIEEVRSFDTLLKIQNRIYNPSTPDCSGFFIYKIMKFIKINLNIYVGGLRPDISENITPTYEQEYLVWEEACNYRFYL